MNDRVTQVARIAPYHGLAVCGRRHRNGSVDSSGRNSYSAHSGVMTREEGVRMMGVRMMGGEAHRIAISITCVYLLKSRRGITFTTAICVENLKPVGYRAKSVGSCELHVPSLCIDVIVPIL